jgi:peptidoglycan hydrolase-like protein with peptidoglycan-binding domain
METCHHCGTVLPKTPGARYCPNCGEMSVPVSGGASDPTQAFAAVGANGQGGQDAPSASSQNGMTWELPLHTQGDPTQAIPTQAFPAQAPPAQSAPPEPDPFAHLYRPEGGEPPRPNATQVMAPVPADFGRAEYGYDQPAYDQPIDYQAAGGGAYAEPYENGYADDYPDEPGSGPSPNRGAKIGIGVAAGAVLVIVVSLITLGGHGSAPSAGPAVTPGSVTTPTGTPSSQSAVANVPSTSAPSSSSSSSALHIPGVLQLGDTGAEVKWLQTRLHQLGLYNGPINSTFDAATQAAVTAFQNKTHPGDPSGVVGRSTKTALIAAGSKPTLTPQLSGGLPIFGGDKHHKGNNPADVKRLQQALSSALNTNVKATGQFDMDTFSAVVQYQSANNLAADGIVNGPVWAALQSGKISG